MDDLFTVNRFLGDEVDGVNEEDESANLAKLLANIEKRKELRKLETIKKSKPIDSKKSDIDIDPSTSLISETNGFEEIASTSHTELSVAETGEKKKKKKKRKVRDLSSDEEEMETEVRVAKTDENVVPGEGFTVLGTDHFQKKSKVKRVLPQWLAKPSVVSVNLQHLSTTVNDIPGIDSDMIDKLTRNNITHFFPVQCQVIPWLLSGIGKPAQFWPRDVCVSAPTGSGKTLAYVIPIVQALKSRVVCRVRALVVLPVQDLAVQVAKVFETYCLGTCLKVALVTGNSKFVEEQNQLISKSLVSGPQSKVDIVVTTTGRIVDHLQSTPGFTLQHLRFLVIDEADRIMENIKNDWLHHVSRHVTSMSGPRHLNVTSLQTLPRPPQKLLFSATLSQDPEKLQQLGLFQPILFTSIVEGHEAEASERGDFVGKYTTPAELVEKVCVVTEEEKPMVLHHLLGVEKKKNVLCFADSQVQAHRLTLLLQSMGLKKYRVAEISAALTRQKREEILKKFSLGEIDLLVSTDSLARGIDLPLVDLVVSYNAPKFVKTYIHRSGRTARAGKCGTAITLVQERQRAIFQRMLAAAGKNPLDDVKFLTGPINFVDSEEARQYKMAIEELRVNLEEEKSYQLEKCKMERRSRRPHRRQKPKSQRYTGKKSVEETTTS